MLRFVSATRIVDSIKYVLCADFKKDFEKGKYFEILSKPFFFLAHIGEAIQWVATHAYTDLGRIAASFAQAPAAKAFIMAWALPCVDICILGGLIAMVGQRIMTIIKPDPADQDRVRTLSFQFTSLVGIAADIICIASILGVIVGIGPMGKAILGIIAGGTGIISTFLQPA